MKIADLNWMQVEEYLERDDRIVLPIGSTEQHGYLSLATDLILAERVAVEAAEPKELAAVDEWADPAEVRRTLGDGSFGGSYVRPDEEMLELWSVAVAEVRELIESSW